MRDPILAVVVLVASLGAGGVGCSNHSQGNSDAGNPDGGGGTPSMLTTASDVNLRSAPSLTASIVGTVPKGAQVTVLDPTPQNNFLNVSYQGKTGWIDLDFLTDPNAVCSLPPATWNMTFTVATNNDPDCPAAPLVINQMVEVWPDVAVPYPGQENTAANNQYIAWADSCDPNGNSNGGGEMFNAFACGVGFGVSVYWSPTGGDACMPSGACSVAGSATCNMQINFNLYFHGNTVEGSGSVSSVNQGDPHCISNGAAVTVSGSK
jgi:Bacterial SH3 domain